MKTLLIIAITGISLMSFAVVETSEFTAKNLEELEIVNLSGDIKVVGSDTNKVKVIANKMTFESNCQMEMNRESETLKIKVSRGGLFESDICNVHFEVFVPKKIALELKSGSGDLEVKNTKGEIELKTGSGDTTVVAEVEELEVSTGSGSIDVEGLTGDAELKTGSGNISLKYSAVPQKGEIDIKTGSGNARILFPPKTKLSTSYRSGSGDLINELGDTQGAKFQVKMRAGSGNLKISSSAGK